AKKEYDRALHLFPLNENGWKPKVKTCSALDNSGLEEIWEMILEFTEKMKRNGHFDKNRSDQRLSWMHEHIKWSLENLFYQNQEIADKLKQVSPLVERGEAPALAIAR